MVLKLNEGCLGLGESRKRRPGELAGIGAGGRLSPARIMERETGGKTMVETMLRTGSVWKRRQ